MAGVRALHFYGAAGITAVSKRTGSRWFWQRREGVLVLHPDHYVGHAEAVDLDERGWLFTT